MNTYIDIYCERLEPGLWAEPINAFTNVSFFIAAFFAYRHAQKQGTVSWQSITLMVLLCAIGTGSTLFHTFATKATMLMDVIPILLYQIAFIGFYTRDIMKLNRMKTTILFAVFAALTVIAENIPIYILNGSLSYAPSILFLFGFGLWHRKNIEQEKNILLFASGVFALSLTFRSIDIAICNALAVGTHFLWHALNGVVLYMAIRSYVRRAEELNEPE